MEQVHTPHNVGPERLEVAVLDWAGTTVDFGSRAPILAILAAFEQAGVPVTEPEARAPMGRAKRDHLAAMLADPGVAERWRRAKDSAPGPHDVDAVFEDFLASQAGCLVDASGVIPGCPEAVAACRRLGLKIGSSTGYSREQLAMVAARAQSEGYAPDAMLSADDISPGRPAPWLCMENARRLGAGAMAAVVKVDDTPAGVLAGRHAGAWSIGVVVSGNEVGLTQEAWDALPATERVERTNTARERLTRAGAHYLIDTIAELPQVVEHVNARLAAGETPSPVNPGETC